jgi:hypothetical protein
MSGPVDEQLLYEARKRPRQAVVAALAGILLMAAAVVQLAGPHTRVDELTLDLIIAHKRFPLDLIAAVINALGSLALAWTLVFLFGITRARNPQVQPWIRILAILGATIAAISGVAYAAVIAAKANHFVTTGSQTYQEAHKLTTSGGIVTLQLLGQAAALTLAVSFVLVSLNAMRVGLLTRFMGYLGIFGGVLILFQITQVPVVQGYWLLALAYLLSGRWPTGVPPSWRSGRAEPWPSSRELRERRAPATGARNGREKPAAKPAPEAVGAASGRGARSPAQKRKRKRRK